MATLKKILLSTLMFLTCTSLSQANIVFKDTQGKSTSFASLEGKWVLINYWAGWCKTCVDEIPELNRFYQNHKNDPVALYAVNFDALPLFEQNNLIKQLNISYPSLLNDPASELNLGDIVGVPVTFVFNPKGQLVNKLYGGQTARSLDKVLTN